MFATGSGNGRIPAIRAAGDDPPPQTGRFAFRFFTGSITARPCS